MGGGVKLPQLECQKSTVGLAIPLPRGVTAGAADAAAAARGGTAGTHWAKWIPHIDQHFVTQSFSIPSNPSGMDGTCSYT